MGRTIKLALYFIGYQSAFAFVGMFIYVLSLYVSTGTLEIPEATTPTFITVTLISGIVSTLAMAAHILGWKYVQLNKETLSVYSYRLLAASCVFVIGMGMWTSYLSEWITTLSEEFIRTMKIMMGNPLGVISVVILAPIVEELVFRGAIMGHLLKTGKSPVFAILVSSLVFGIVHGNLEQAPFAFILGLALGWVYYRTGSLLPSICMHFVNNGLTTVNYYLSDNPFASMQEEMGLAGATLYAIGGILISLACIFYIRKKLVPQSAKWKEESKESVLPQEV